jgi:PAS domain S-box-containing protein
MKKIHSLLKRQLKRYCGSQDAVPREWREFIQAANDAYCQFDADRKLLERSLELSSQELLEANSELRAIFQALPDLFFRLDHEGTITDCKGGRTTVFVVPVEKLVGKRIQDIPFGQVGSKFLQAIHDIRETKSIVNIEYSMMMEGRENYYEARLLPFLGVQIIAIVRNITVRKRAELEVEKLQRYNRGLIEASLDPLVTFDQEGIILDVNGATVKATGRTREALIGTPFATYFTDPEKARKGAMLVFEAGEVRDYELVMEAADGTRTIVAYNASVYRDQTGQVVGAFAAARDITELKQSEAEVRKERDKVKETMEKLIETQDRLIRSERFAAIGEAAAYLSHEIKNPLTIIGGFARQIEKSLGEDHGNRQKLKIIRDEIRRLELMLTDVKDFTRPSKPQLELQDINSVIESILALLDNDLGDKGIDYEKNLDRDLPLVFFDQRQIEQVLINLIKNAVEAMPDGGRLIVSSWFEDERIKVSIVDSGSGMPPEIVQKIFNPFFTTKKKGTGLGLAVCQKIMEDHEGRIFVQSEQGKGTRFTIEWSAKRLSGEPWPRTIDVVPTGQS